MGQRYVNNNVIKDLFVEILRSNYDFTAKGSSLELHNTVHLLLSDSLYNENDIAYLDFDIVVGYDKNDITIKANNIVCGLWFYGIIPKDSDKVINDGYLIYNNHTYKFNKKGGYIHKKKITNSIN
jgi:hypothetical protein